MRVLRSHRLWERYLADRTSVQPVDWHQKAEIAEHRLSEQEANLLASRMGHPLYDPLIPNQTLDLAFVITGKPVIVPEPAGLGLIGLALLAVRKRRR